MANVSVVNTNRLNNILYGDIQEGEVIHVKRNMKISIDPITVLNPSISVTSLTANTSTTLFTAKVQYSFTVFINFVLTSSSVPTLTITYSTPTVSYTKTMSLDNNTVNAVNDYVSLTCGNANGETLTVTLTSDVNASLYTTYNGQEMKQEVYLR